jgi:hypothetical protein
MRLLLPILFTLFSLPAFSSSYTKIANNGTALAASAVLGDAPTDWACTRDETTGLIWEMKILNPALRSTALHAGHIFTHYDDPTQAQKKEGNTSNYRYFKPTQAEIDADTNSIGFVNAVNVNGMCGHSDWRIPSKDELLALVDSTNVVPNAPKIDSTFFPSTAYWSYWSSSPDANEAHSAWVVNFGDGTAGSAYRSSSVIDDTGNYLRLVRGGQSSETFALTLGATDSGSGSVSSNPGNLNCASSAGATSGTCSTRLAGGTTVTLSATPATGSTFIGWSGACYGTSPTCTLIVTAAKSVTALFGLAASNYYFSKIANDGSVLPASALLGDGPTDWACSRDDKTGLIWQVHTRDGGLLDMNKHYLNFDDPSSQQIRVNINSWRHYFIRPSQSYIEGSRNSIGLVNAVNARALCASRAWRLPDRDELQGLARPSYHPMINPIYFPNTSNSDFWVTGQYSADGDRGAVVSFVNGDATSMTPRDGRRNTRVRLVSGVPASGLFALLLGGNDDSAPGTVTASAGGINCPYSKEAWGGTCSASLSAGTRVTLTATPSNGSTFAGWGGACSGTDPCTLTLATTSIVFAKFNEGRINAVEFYNSTLKHFFLTIDPSEAAAIDAGAAGPGWTRTGGSFKVLPTQIAGSAPVCRFYGSVNPGPNSHFFTVNADECADLRAQEASTPETVKKWHYEGTPFYLFTPQNDVCAAGTTAVDRYYNNGFARGEDANHRLTTDSKLRASMETSGWVYEGVKMCAP